MWRDVFLSNRDAVLEMLGRFNEDLAALAPGNPVGRWRRQLFDLFTRTRAIRRKVVAIGRNFKEKRQLGRPHDPLPLAPLPRPYASDSD